MGIFIFAQLDDETGGRCARDIHQHWTRPRNLSELLVEARPIERHPVITGIAAKDRARLKPNYCFTAIPDPSGAVTVPGANEQISAVTGHTARAPYTAADGAASGTGGPCCYTGRIIYRYAHQPSIKNVTIPVAPICNINNVAHDAERRTLHVVRWNESRAILMSRQLHIHRPARVNGPRVHVKRNNVMFLGRTAIGRGQRAQKQRP